MAEPVDGKKDIPAEEGRFANDALFSTESAKFAATAIQAGARGLLARRRVRELRYSDKEEKRLGSDNAVYTKDQFIEFFGETDGQTLWNNAEPYEDFEPAPSYQGSKLGYIFRTGGRGLGYYRDIQPGKVSGFYWFSLPSTLANRAFLPGERPAKPSREAAQTPSQQTPAREDAVDKKEVQQEAAQPPSQQTPAREDAGDKKEVQQEAAQTPSQQTPAREDVKDANSSEWFLLPSTLGNRVEVFLDDTRRNEVAGKIDKGAQDATQNESDKQIDEKTPDESDKQSDEQKPDESDKQTDEAKPEEATGEKEEVKVFQHLAPLNNIVWLELKKGVLTTNEEAMQVFEDEHTYVNPIMVSGRLRTGKSYLMNALSDSNCFGVSSQARSFTQGVHVCDRLVTADLFGAPKTAPLLAFVDAEGQADKGKSYDIKLATPLLLVSKIIILNEVCPTGPSKEDILRTLEIMMRAAEQVSSKEGRSKLFGHMHLMMRDCSQPEQECWDIIFEIEDPAESETQEQSKAIEERNQIRQGIFDSFESTPKVWCLPKMMMYPAPKNYRDASPEYVNKIHEIRAFMAVQLEEPKMLDGKPLTGTMIANLMPQLTEALKSDSPILNPPTMMQAVCDLEADRMVQKDIIVAERFFKLDFVKQMPMESPQFEGEVDCQKALMIQALKEKIQHLPKESQMKAFPRFEQQLGLMDERITAVNREKLADKITQELRARTENLEYEKEMERRRADEARAEIDDLMAAREKERERADMLFKQIEEMSMEREQEKDRINELEELLAREATEREADLERKLEEEQMRLAELEAERELEEEKRAAEEEEKERILEEQRAKMEEMERELEEQQRAREEAEAELGAREEDHARQDEAAELIEQLAEQRKEPALICAVKESNSDAVHGILRHHPDSLNVKDKNQRSPLHFASDEKCAMALVKANAEINAQDMAFWTPLHNASNGGHIQVCRVLMDAGADVLLTTSHGNTALDLSYNKPDITTMLLSTIPELYSTLEVPPEEEWWIKKTRDEDGGKPGKAAPDAGDDDAESESSSEESEP